MSNLNKRIDNLENKKGSKRGAVGIRWPDQDFIIDTVTGEHVDLAEWKRRHPGSKEITLKWADDD